jgi:hypothetical protein
MSHRRSTFVGSTALFAALALAGCSGTAGFEGPDPLTGGPPIQRRTSPAPTLAAGLSSSPAASPASPPTGQLPPLPAPGSATSQAALAAGVSQPLDSGRDLRIGASGSFAQEQPLWKGVDNAPPAPARLNDPRSDAPASAGPAPGLALTAGTTRVDTLDAALRQLRTGRRVTWQRLESLDDGTWRFRCAVANPGRPNAELNYDARGATEVEAVRRVLDQIALEQR